MKTLARQHKQLPIFFGNILIKTGTETELILDCHRGTDGSLVTALELYSMFGSLVVIESRKTHEVITAMTVEVFLGILQTEQKHIGNGEKR